LYNKSKKASALKFKCVALVAELVDAQDLRWKFECLSGNG